MLEVLGKTQQQLLKMLLAHKAGLTIDRLAAELGITRTAVRQHVTALEGQGYLARGLAVSTGGRPGQHYILTARGNDLFPKQYALFSEILLRAICAEKGEEGLKAWLGARGAEVARAFSANVHGATLRERITETVAVMNQLAYEARTGDGEEQGSALPVIEAENCVYHDLAAEYREVCQFDVALISGLTGATVERTKCIQDGDNVCRFCFKR